MAAEDVKEAQGGGTTEATGHVEQEGSTKILFLAPTFVNILTQTLHFSTFSVTSGKKTIQIVPHKCSGPLRPFHLLTDILEGLINLPCFIL